MAAAYCYEGIPLRCLASLFDIQMRSSVYGISIVVRSTRACLYTLIRNGHLFCKYYTCDCLQNFFTHVSDVDIRLCMH